MRACVTLTRSARAQVNGVNPRPGHLIGATVAVMLFGPIALGCFFLRDRVMGKKH